MMRALLALMLTLLPATSFAKDKPLLVMFGDSLTAGYNLPHGAGVPEQLEKWFARTSCPVQVINAGVSGDTTSGGLARVDWVLASLPPKGANLVMVELGGNDALRGISPALSKSNLAAIIDAFHAKKMPVALAGMQAPPNMGADYEKAFNSIYKELSVKKSVPLYPFFLEGVAAKPELNLPDHIHPNEKGVAVIVAKLGPFLTPLLCKGG